jgi:hypothetical protein
LRPDLFSTIGPMNRRWVSKHEATEMAKYGILLPPNAIVLKAFDIRLGGVPVSPISKGMDFDVVVYDRKQKEKLWLEREIRAPDRGPTRFHEDRGAALVHFTSEEPAVGEDHGLADPVLVGARLHRPKCHRGRPPQILHAGR